LGNDQLFVTNGITVTNMLPRELIVFVDPVVTREVEVKPPPDVAKTIEKVTFEPRRVTVSAPQSYFNRHPALEAQADLRLDALTAQSEAVAVAVAVPERTTNGDISVTPATVNAKYDPKAATPTGELKSVVVKAVASPAFYGKYTIEFPNPNERSVYNVKVIGPKATIDKLATNDPQPWAEFDVDVEQGTDKDIPATLRFILPQGVQVDPSEPPHTITYRLKLISKE
jgi:hypothetical protein